MLAIEVDLKKSVMAALGTQDGADLFGVQRERDGFAFAAIEDGGDSTGGAEPACFVFAARGAGCCFYYNLLLSHAFSLRFILLRRAKARPYIAIPYRVGGSKDPPLHGILRAVPVH